ncbi:serine/threonine protein kinase [Streptomyces filipinensis]|uniref:non-specific serine/threonine protein kinase n=1 Tax=Streptomyces filipinensis TaxID=66887 RepID=A0A918IH48_9ACTN|nr:serine/threonine protein kinase [Streptomyces filipinensis]GGV17789.1 serine/threonine protein kinase [Streptomyces filipinensis]
MNGEQYGVEPLEEGDPRRIGPIPLVGRLGAGGMGRVYLGVHKGRYAAVKQVLPSVVGEDKDFVRRFGHELDNLSRLPAGATAPLLAGDRDARPPWFATAYVPGLTLREAVEAHGGPLPAESLWLLLREAAVGLAAVHGLDMVHRDVKPSNVMLTLDGVTLIDFGVARAAEQSRLTRTGMVVGTPAYMSPEQASGARRLTGAVDVFALGSVVAYAGSGRPPFGDESGHGVLYRIVHERPDLAELRALDPELASVVASCLDKDPEGRPSAAELLDLTAGHAPSGPPRWPTGLTELLTSRTDFATRVPEPDPDGEAGPGSEGAGPGGGRAEGEVVVRPGGRRRERERRGRRVLVAVVPIVAGAGVATLAFQLAPYATDAHRAGAAGTPGASVSAPADPAPGTSSASPSGTPGPSGRGAGKKGSAAPAGAEKKHGESGAHGAKGGTTDDRQSGTGGSGGGSGTGSGGSGAGAGGAGSDRSGEGGGSGPGPGGSGSSGGSSGSGSSGGSSGSGSSGGSGGSTGGGGGSGAFRLKNGENGKCLIQVYGSSALGDCSDSTARWTFRSAAGGSVKVVNVSTGACLSANGNGQAVFAGDCAQGGGNLRWTTGSGASLRTVFDGGCLDLAFGGGVAEASCQSGASSQRWART